MLSRRWTPWLMLLGACRDDGAHADTEGSTTAVAGTSSSSPTMGTADTTLGTESGDVTSVTSSADTTSGSGSTGSSGGTGSSSAGTGATDTTTGVETTGTGSSGTDTGSSSDDGPACMLPDESSSDGGEPPLDLGLDGGCGNGVVEGAEFCDDGNQEPGDGCEVDCTSSDDVPTEFFLTMGGPNGFGDLGSGVAFDSAGNLIISGFVANEVWIRKYDVDYEELWTVTYPGQPGNIPFPTVVAIDSQDNPSVPRSLKPASPTNLL